MKKNTWLIIVLLLASTLSACRVATPAAEAISEANADALQVSLSQSVGSGTSSITWGANGAALWLQDLSTVLFLDGASGQESGRFAPGADAVIYDTAADAQMIAYALGNDEIRLADLKTEKNETVISTGFPYSDAFFSPDGKTLAVPSMDEIAVVFYDTASGQQSGSVSGFSTAAPVYSAQFSPDGKTLLWISRGTVQPMQIASQEMGPVLSHEDFVNDVLASPDGKVIATSAAGTLGAEFQPLLTLWNANNGSILAQMASPAYYSAISFSPDSKLIAAGSEDGIIIFTSPYGEEVGRYASTEAIADLAFSPDGTRLAAMTASGLLNVYAP